MFLAGVENYQYHSQAEKLAGQLASNRAQFEADAATGTVRTSTNARGASSVGRLDGVRESRPYRRVHQEKESLHAEGAHRRA